jgi:pimeloyl-ACP methyl ester carboxylesterase
LYVIRDIDTPVLLPRSRLMDGLMSAALKFTDESTKGVKVEMGVCARFKEEIGRCFGEGEVDEVYVEAAMVVGTYNMVSRFLVSTDVGGMSDVEVPWPVERTEVSVGEFCGDVRTKVGQRFVSVPSFPPLKEPRHEIHCVTLKGKVDAPWLVFSNGLVTDMRMWSYVIPELLDYNMLLHSQRGHGQSGIPEGEGATTIEYLAKDMGYVVDEIGIGRDERCVIGVSQGGATTLAYGGMYGARRMVVCGTAAATPAGNKEAWEERTRVEMGRLAGMTVARWFPSGSSCHPGSGRDSGRVEWMERMIVGTSRRGFVHGAKALGCYDVYANGGKQAIERGVDQVLLIAGELDGGGRVGRGMQKMQAEWEGRAEYVQVEGSGHLPMIDCPDVFCDLVLSFLL